MLFYANTDSFGMCCFHCQDGVFYTDAEDTGWHISPFNVEQIVGKRKVKNILSSRVRNLGTLKTAVAFSSKQ